MNKRAVRGFHHHHTDEELLRYRALSAEQKLIWLHAAWRFTCDFLPAAKRERFEKMRRGDV